MNRMKRLLCLGLICYFCCLSMIVYGNEKTSPFYLAELKCENLIDPLGIDNVTPHFSWKLKGDGWKGGQTYYEIQVASDSILLVQDKADLWNTGKLKSNASVMVPYQGKALTSRSPKKELYGQRAFGMLKNKLHHGVLLPVLELASWISHR